MFNCLNLAGACFRVSVLVLGLAFVSTQLSGGPAFAASDSPSPSPAVKKCKKRGYVWSKKLKKCVRRTSEILTDEDLYAQAWLNAQAGEHQAALDLLWRIKDQKQAKVLNYIGYNTRKLGRVEDGIRYYHKALALNPNYNKAREYLGEGYLQTGSLGKAKVQLKEIKARCGVNCDEYRQLAKAITDYKTRVN